MKNSFKAMKESAGEKNTSIIGEIAHRIRVSGSCAYKWTEAPERSDDSCDEKGSGNKNPLDTLIRWIEACLILGRPRKNALAPLRYLNQHFDQIAVDIPEHIKSLPPEELSNELLRCIKESGDVVKAYQDAMVDKRISKQELVVLEREVWEATTEFLTFLHCSKEAAK